MNQKNPRKRTLIFITLMTGLLLTCCTRNIILLSPQDEFALGEYYLQNEKYNHATKQFEKIRTNYPTSQYATASQIKLAESFFIQEHYDEAAVDFALFLEFHPAHKLAPFAQYHLALSKFRSMLNAERDVSLAKEALIEFDKFLTLYPEAPEHADAIEYRKKTEDHLFWHEFAVARLYYRLKVYDASIARIKTVPDRAHDPNLKQETLYLLAQNYIAKKEWEDARETLDKLLLIDKTSKFGKMASEKRTMLPQD